jgi:MFS family permease
MLVAAIFLLRLFGQGLMGHAAMVAMARWFVATRGRAVSVAGLGVATGEALLPLTFVALMGVFDWRLLWLLASATLLALSPVLWSLLRQERTPQSFAKASGSTGMQGRMWTRGEALRHPVFWLMLPALLGPAAWNTAFFFQQVHVAEAKGWAHVTLVSLFPLYTATSVAFMLIAGWLVDRLGSTRLAAAYLLPLAAGYLVFAFAGSVPVAGLGIVLIGASVGMNVTMMATFWAEVFGTRHLGAIRAMMAAVMVLGTAVGPAITGALIDLGVDFPTQGFGIAVYFAATAVLAAFAGRKAAGELEETAGHPATGSRV